MHSSDSKKPSERVSVTQSSEKELTLFREVVVESARDRRVLTWLVSQVGEEAVATACNRLAGRRRLYVSNIAKALGVTPPNDLVLTPLNDAKRRLAHCKNLLRGGK